MKSKENSNKIKFYKTNPRGGISLIVLVITIIVIIILAAAIIISLQRNNPISEANRARIESDVANMQAIFTNTVAKVMADRQDTVSIESGILNTVTSGVKNTTGDAVYKLSDGIIIGQITFDSKPNEENRYYTGRKLPIYSKETTWHVDAEGILRLQLGDNVYIGGNNNSSGDITEEGTVSASAYNELLKREKL